MAVSQEPKIQALVDSLKRTTPEMQKYPRNLKRWGKDELERLDFVWHIQEKDRGRSRQALEDLFGLFFEHRSDDLRFSRPGGQHLSAG